LIASLAPRPAISSASSARVSPASTPVLRPSQTSAISSSSERASAARGVAAGGDVGVELVGAGDEPLRVVRVAERRPLTDEHRAGLQQVAGRLRWKLGARRDPDLVLVDVDRRARRPVLVGHRFGLDPAAADPELAHRRSVRTAEEAADYRLRDAGPPTPAVEPLRKREMLDRQPCLPPRVADEVDGRLLAVGETVAEKLVARSERLRRHPCDQATEAVSPALPQFGQGPETIR
jgi:hypothetical protein